MDLPKVSVEIIRIQQDVKVLELTRVQDGKTTHTRYALDGKEEKTKSPQGDTTKRKVSFSKNSFEIESISQLRGSSDEVHTKEKWQLSPDSKTLTIQEKTGMQVRMGGTADSFTLDMSTIVYVYSRIE